MKRLKGCCRENATGTLYKEEIRLVNVSRKSKLWTNNLRQISMSRQPLSPMKRISYVRTKYKVAYEF